MQLAMASGGPTVAVILIEIGAYRSKLNVCSERERVGGRAGPGKPLHGLRIVLRDTLTVKVHQPEIGLS